MCSANEWIQFPSRRFKVRVQRLILRRRNHKEMNKTATAEQDQDMELMNLKLYLENICILEENQILRKKALCLRQQNLALLSQFQN